METPPLISKDLEIMLGMKMIPTDLKLKDDKKEVMGICKDKVTIRFPDLANLYQIRPLVVRNLEDNLSLGEAFQTGRFSKHVQARPDGRVEYSFIAKDGTRTILGKEQEAEIKPIGAKKTKKRGFFTPCTLGDNPTSSSSGEGSKKEEIYWSAEEEFRKEMEKIKRKTRQNRKEKGGRRTC